MLHFLCHSDWLKASRHHHTKSSIFLHLAWEGLWEEGASGWNGNKSSAPPRGSKLSTYTRQEVLCLPEGHKWTVVTTGRSLAEGHATQGTSLSDLAPNSWRGTSLERPPEQPGCFALSASITKPHDKWWPVSSLLFLRAPQKDITLNRPAGPDTPCPSPPTPATRKVLSSARLITGMAGVQMKLGRGRMGSGIKVDGKVKRVRIFIFAMCPSANHYFEASWMETNQETSVGLIKSYWGTAGDSTGDH